MNGRCLICGKPAVGSLPDLRAVEFCAEHVQFPVLVNTRAEREVGIPLSVPYASVRAHQRQIEANHGQTLERLAQRGGLSAEELWVGMHDKSLSVLLYDAANQIPSVDVLADWLRSLNHREEVL